MFRMKKALLVAATAVLGAGYAWAIDVNEIAQLIRNDVQDTVIINMVQNQKLDRPLSANDVLLLSSAGASGSLLEYMTRPEAVSSNYVAPSAPVVMESPPIQVQSAPTVVTTQPNVVVAAPQPTYVYPYSSPYYYYNSNPYYYNRRPTYSFSFGWGGHRRGPPPRYHGRPGGRGGRPPRRR